MQAVRRRRTPCYGELLPMPFNLQHLPLGRKYKGHTKFMLYTCTKKNLPGKTSPIRPEDHTVQPINTKRDTSTDRPTTLTTQHRVSAAWCPVVSQQRVYATSKDRSRRKPQTDADSHRYSERSLNNRTLGSTRYIGAASVV